MRMPGFAAVLTVAGMLSFGMIMAATTGCGSNETPPPGPSVADTTARAGWTLVWHDEFNGPAIDTGIWNFEVNGNGGGNNELQYYTSESRNAFIENGTLVIQALKEAYLGKQYTSARLNTSGKKALLYGRVDVRAKLPYGRGLWPAIWMLPTDWTYGGWPASGEIDIMELLGQDPNKIYGTIHWGADAAHHQQAGTSYILSSGSFAGGFHEFSLEWSADSLKWFIDNRQYFAQPTFQPFDKRFHVLLNVAVGGNWPGSPDGSTVFPQTMQVDYVRVYSKAN
jgi:beta-glucanase (GH16 family)